MEAKSALNLFKATAVVLVTAVAFVFCACTKEQNAPVSNEQEKPQILVSSYVPYTLVKNIVKDMADVSMLMPPGVEPHSFEPLPKDILKAKEAKVFIYLDRSLEPWAYEIKKHGNSESLFLLPTEEMPKELHHIWMNFPSAAGGAAKAYSFIKHNYPSLEEQKMRENLKKFEADMKTLHQNYLTKLENCKSRDIYHIGHLAFGWFARNYNLNFKPLVNSSEAQEPSPKDILEMIKQIKEKNIKYIFTEETLSPKMADLIAKQTGAQILMLYTIEHITKEEFDKQITYQDFMYKNLENLTKGLECN